MDLAEIERRQQRMGIRLSPDPWASSVPVPLLEYLIEILSDHPSPVPSASVDDWWLLLDLIYPHKMVPFFFLAAKKLPPDHQPPEPVMMRLKELYIQNRLRGLMLEVQLKEALAAIRVTGVEPVVLKGLAVAWGYYSDPAARPTSDIDLLATRKDFPAVRDALLQLGYRDLYRRFENRPYFFQEETFEHPRSEYCIDLHWAMHFVNRIDRPKEVQGLMERSVEVRGAKVSFRAQRTADEFIQACRHLIWNHFHEMQLIWIWDLKMMGLRLDAEGGWQEVRDRAAEFHVANSIGLALDLVRAWTGYSPPGPFGERETWDIDDPLEREIWSRLRVGHMKPRARLWLVWNPDWPLRRKIGFGFRLLFPSVERVQKDYPPPRTWLLFTSYLRRFFHAVADFLTF